MPVTAQGAIPVLISI